MNLDQYQQFFRSLGIATLEPGFFDDPAFFRAEEKNKRLLEDYARYCQLVSADEPYCARAHSIVSKTVAFIAPHVLADKRQGMCVKVSLLLSRFLERQGVWSYIENGGLVIQYPDESRLPPKELDPHFFEGGTHGHAWLVAPPFRIIDLAITRQFYGRAEEKYAPNMIVAEATLPAEPWPFPQGAPNGGIMRSFPPARVSQGGLTLTYVPYGIGGPSESFQTMAQPSFGGKRPFELYEEYAREVSVA